MKPSVNRLRKREGAGARLFLFMLSCFFVGVAVGALWFLRKSEKATNAAEGGAGGPQVTLSPSTLAVLKRLKEPVTVRFYSLLDPASVPAAVQALSQRVEPLLAEYARQAEGKLTVTRYQSMTDANTAFAEGVKPFNLDKGDACYLGIVVTCPGHKEVLSRLAPEWESALEPDVSRAIEQTIEASQPLSSKPVTTPLDPAVVEEVKHLIPELNSVSIEEGTRLLREASLKEFKQAVQAMQAKEQEVQQRLSQAQTAGSQTEQQEARKQLQQLQADQAEQLKQIAARSEARIDALRELKAHSQ